MRTRVRKAFSGMVWLSLLGLAWLLAVAGVQAQTSSPDVAMVTKLSGPATYWNKGEQKQPAPVQAFMKVRQGDYFKIPPESTLQILYFASGRQETWKGPVTLLAGPEESKIEGKMPPSSPEVKLLPARVGKRIDCAPLPLPRSSVRYSGVIQTMGPLCAEARKDLKDAESIYQSLRQQVATDDLTPELYYLSVLAEYQQYPEMEKLLNSMLAKRPGDPALKRMQDWVRRRGQSAP